MSLIDPSFGLAWWIVTFHSLIGRNLTRSLHPHGDQFIDYREDNPVDWRSGFAILTFYKGMLLMPELVQVLDGKDVIRIFVTQAVTIGIMGVIGGMIMATVLITFLKKVYVGSCSIKSCDCKTVFCVSSRNKFSSIIKLLQVGQLLFIFYLFRILRLV